MANRGRPRKSMVDESEIQDAEIEDVNLEENSANSTSDSDLVGDGTFSDYNPFSENVVERDYATPKTAQGVTDEIEEPTFIPPSYEDIIAERTQAQEQEQQQNAFNPFDNPNPAMNELDDRDKKIACESLVDTCLDAYEQAHRYAQYVVKVDEEELMQKQAEGKIDLSIQIPVAENGDTMSVGEFVAQYNEQSTNALKYDKEFGYKVRPAMIRVFMKRGWGMTDEQFLLYMFGKDIAVKLGIMYSLKKTINSTLETLEKAQKRNRAQSNVEVYERTTQTRQEVRDEPMPQNDILEIDEDDIIEEEPMINDSFTQGMNINMPQNPKDPMSEHPKEVRRILRKNKKGNGEE